MSYVHRHATLPGYFLLCVAGPCLAQQVVLTPKDLHAVYKVGETAQWKVEVRSAGGAPTEAAFPTQLTYTIRKNGTGQGTSGTAELTAGVGTIEATLDESGALYLEVRNPLAAGRSGGGFGRGRGGAGGTVMDGVLFSPEKLQPSAPRPSDFDAFWDGKLKALAQVPINPVLTSVQTNRAGVELSTVKLDSLNSHTQGYLAKAAREGKFPAVIIFEWAGVHALQPNGVADRAAEGWLAFNVESHDMPPNQATDVSNNYQAVGNTDKEVSYFLNMYLRDARAIDYIASRPDWDGKTLVVMGDSMGGQQSVVMGGLHPKVTAVCVNVPSGCDVNAQNNSRGEAYPNWPNNPQVMETARYFDPVNFASHIKAPTLMALGLYDTTSFSVNVHVAYNQIPGVKEMVIMHSPHNENGAPNTQQPYKDRSKQWLAALVKGEPVPPK